MTAEQMINRLKEFPADREIIIIPEDVKEGEAPVEYEISFYYGAFLLKSRFRIYRKGPDFSPISFMITYGDKK